MKLFKSKTSNNTRQVQELLKDLHCAQDNCLSLNHQLQRQEDYITNTHSILHESESQRYSLKKKLADTNAALTASQAQAVDLHLKNQNLSEENKRLKDLVSEMEERSDSQRENYEFENRRLMDLLSQMKESSNSKSENYELVINSLKSLFGQVQVDNKNLESRMGQMKTVISKSKQDVEDLQTQLLQTTKDFQDQLILQRDNFQKDLLKYRAEADQMVKKAKEEKEVTKAAHDKAVGEIEKLRLQFQELQETNLSLQKEKVVLTEQFNKYKDQESQKFSHLDSELKEKNQNIEKLQQQLSKTSATEQQATKALHKAVEKMRSAQETYAESAQKNYMLECTIKNLQEDIKNMKVAHSRAMEEAVNTTKQSSQEDYIKELEDNLQHAADIIVEKDRDIECLQITRDDCLERNVKMTETIAEQEKTITELKEKQSREDLRNRFDERQRGRAWPPGKQSNWNNYRRK